MNLSAIARPTCSWCDGTGAWKDGRPCILCAGKRLSHRQYRWRVETRYGMAYHEDGDAEPRHRLPNVDRDLALAKRAGRRG